MCFVLNWLPSVLWRCWLGGRKGIRPVKNRVVGCWRGYLSGTRCRLAYGPADATATHCLLLHLNLDWLCLLVPAHPGSPRQRSVKRVCVRVRVCVCVCACVCACVCVCVWLMNYLIYCDPRITNLCRKLTKVEGIVVKHLYNLRRNSYEHYCFHCWLMLLTGMVCVRTAAVRTFCVKSHMQ